MRGRWCVGVVCVVAVLAAAAAASAQGGRRSGAEPIPSIADRTNGFKKIDGFFPMYWDEAGGRLLLEIPRLDTEVLYSTGLATGLGSNDIGLDRGQGGAGRIVRFERVGPRVMLTQANQTFRSSSASALERKAVEDSFRKVAPKRLVAQLDDTGG